MLECRAMFLHKLSRRSFLKSLAALYSGALLAPISRALLITQSPNHPTLRLRSGHVSQSLLSSDLITVRGDQFYYRGERFPIRGFNYYPRTHPWKTYNIGEWERGAIEYELRLGASLGANVVRTFVDFNYSLDNTRAQQPIDNYYAPISRYIDNVREFINVAAQFDLKVILTLLDSMDWAMYQPQNAWMVEEYLRALVPLFVDDPRILCWDLQNEPDKAIREVGAGVVIPFFKHISALVRALDPNHLQTIGWIDRARAAFYPDFNELLDFWCFHFYDNASNLPALIQFYKSKTSKPVMLQEFGLATGGPGADGAHTEIDQAAHYTQVMTMLDDNKMCGSVFWVLTDFPQGLAGNPPSPLDSPENHFGVFRLDYAEKPVAAIIRSLWGAKR